MRYVIHSLPRFCVIAKHLPTVHATLNPFIYWSEKLELLIQNVFSSKDDVGKLPKHPLNLEEEPGSKLLQVESLGH